MRHHLLFLALAHVIVLLSQAHWPIDDACIALAYSLTWISVAMPDQLNAILRWLSQTADQQVRAWLCALTSWRRLSPPKFRIALIIDGMRVKVEFQAL
jgi:hypothetical protein